MTSKTNKRYATTLVADDNPNITGFYERYANWIAGAMILATLLMGLLLFDMKLDEGGDDSTYITRAIDLVNNGTYPTYQGPLYPMFLGALIALFGTRIFLLKLSSLLLVALSQFIFYRTLKRHVNIRLLFSVMGLLSINSWYLYFASMTYSEPLFIVVMFGFMAALMRLEDTDGGRWQKVLPWALTVGATVVLAGLIRTVGFGLGIVAVAYLCLRRKYIKVAWVAGAIAALMLMWTGIRAGVWGEIKTDNRQLESLMQVHPYQTEDGQETLTGYFMRVVDNSNLYISKHLMRIVGFKAPADRTTNGLLTVIVYLIFGYGAYRAWKQNRFMMLMAVLSIVMIGITFVVLQALWDQERLIIPYLAPALMVLLYGLYHLLRLAAGKRAQWVLMAIVILMGMLSLSRPKTRIDTQRLKRYANGDVLQGYTTDYYNYLNMCQLVYDKVPEGSYVACRKPNMARIYSGGHKFYGIYNFYTEDPDSLANDLRNKGVTHIIVASLRRDPMVPRAEVINTIHRYMNCVMAKYPKAFNCIGICGSENNEPTYLFDIDYGYIDAIRNGQTDATQQTDGNE